LRQVFEYCIGTQLPRSPVQSQRGFVFFGIAGSSEFEESKQTVGRLASVENRRSERIHGNPRAPLKKRLSGSSGHVNSPGINGLTFLEEFYIQYLHQIPFSSFLLPQIYDTATALFSRTFTTVRAI
jgi:hypothetical protein